MFAEIAMLVLINIGTVGGLLWAVLHFGLSHKLAEMKTEHEAALRIQHANHEAQLKAIQAQLDANLNAMSHARNTVFSRYDEKRAEVILKLNSAVSRFTRLSFELGFPVLNGEAPAIACLTKAMALKAVSEEALAVVGENLFFFTEDLKKPMGLWCHQANQLCQVAASAAFQLSEDQAFKQLSRSEQHRSMKASVEAATEDLSKTLVVLKNEIINILEKSFRDSTPLHGYSAVTEASNAN